MYIGLTCIYVFSHIVRWRMVVSLSAVIGCVLFTSCIL